MPRNSKVQPLRPPPSITPPPDSVRKVFIKDLVGTCALGIHRHEKGTRQRVRINLELSCRWMPSAQVPIRSFMKTLRTLSGGGVMLGGGRSG